MEEQNTLMNSVILKKRIAHVNDQIEERLQNMPMETDVAGRIRNVTLPASKPLLPLYEAIVNSIHAIEDSRQSNGQIEIVIVRDNNHLFGSSEEDRGLGPITGFSITDNGIGFTDDNFHAFKTADTTYKAGRGGKGVGRFLWLVAFDRVEIESLYQHEGDTYERRFLFLPADDGIKEDVNHIVFASENRTTIKLVGFVEKYQKTCPKKIETIASHIVEHCLKYLIRADCPRMTLRDLSSAVSIDLNAYFRDEIVSATENSVFHVKGENFLIKHILLRHTHVNDHMTHYCAHSRDVVAAKLTGRIPNLSKALHTSSGERFYYAGYVEGTVLNQTVNTERTGFSLQPFGTEASLFPQDEITWGDICEETEKEVEKFLKPYTDPVKVKKTERINRYLATDGPMYRPIMKYIDEKVDMIDPDADDDQLDLKLYEAYHYLQVQLKNEGSKLLSSEADMGVSYEEYSERLDSYFEKVSDINMADLARYVCHRRSVLDFLHKQLSKRSDEKYPLEDRVHSIIFPMGVTSDEVFMDGHNLWIIDEKLAYHAFLASDKPLRSLQAIKSSSKKEPDLILFDTACAFAPAVDPPYPAIVIVEFKRAMRDDYTMDKNPFVQVREYITEIKSGNVRTADGRDVPIRNDVPFYCYIICDLSSTLEKWAMDFELLKTPDDQGFFGFKRHYNAYFEVISYSKMVTDAKKRNAVLFDKLGISTRVNSYANS